MGFPSLIRLSENSLSKRYFLMPAMLFVFFLAFNWLYRDIKNNSFNDYSSEQLLLAQTASLGVSSFIDNYISNLSFVVKDEDIVSFSDKGKLSMQQFYETHKNDLNAITRVDANGTILYTYPYVKSAIGSDISQQEHVKKIHATKKPVISNIFKSVQGYYAIGIHVPIFKQEEFVGSMAILIPVDKIGEIFLGQIKQNKRINASLITDNYTVIYCTDKSHIGKTYLVTSEFDDKAVELLNFIEANNSGIEQAVDNHYNNIETDVDDTFVAFDRVPIQSSKWTVLITFQKSNVSALLLKYRNRLLVIFTLLFIGLIFYLRSFTKAQNILKEEVKRKRAETLLKESNDRFNSFMDNTPMYAYIKDSKLNHIYENKKVLELRSQHNADNPDGQKLFADEVYTRLHAANEQILKGKKDYIELEFKTKINGETLWLRDLKFKINLAEDKIGVAGATFDVTRIKNYESELEEHKFNLEKLVKNRTKDLESANKKLENLNQELVDQKEELETTLESLKEAQTRLVQSEKMASLGILTAGISHEINNPLHYLSGAHFGLQSYLEKYGSQDKEKTDLLLSSIQITIDRISSIVKGLNEFSKESTDFNEDCNIHSIIDNCLTVMHNEHLFKIDITREYSKDIISINGNKSKLHQAFFNVLLNALQSINDKGRITINTSLEKSYAIIEVTDNGTGISESDLPKVTDPFFTTKHPGQGTGLGLSITYSIIKDHKGDLIFESKIGIGTKVTIKLPLGN